MVSTPAEYTGSARPFGARSDTAWGAAREQFLAALDAGQRDTVARLLRQPHYGGTGLRQWLCALAAGIAVLPDAGPPALIQVYLTDPEAMPLHDCADCGLAVPVRPGRLYACVETAERVYFPLCPACGAPTGHFARLSRIVNPSDRC